MWFLISDINKLENATTAVRAIHITKVVFKLVVTAKAEQIPSICSAIGLLLNIGDINTSFEFDIYTLVVSSICKL